MAEEKNRNNTPLGGSVHDAAQWEAFAEELQGNAAVVYELGEYSAYNALHRTALAAKCVASRIRMQCGNG